jgi:ABC-type Mn2+/Zn2+ transport system permease subunit
VFGSVLGRLGADVWLELGVAAVTVVVVGCYRSLLFTAFDPRWPRCPASARRAWRPC